MSITRRTVLKGAGGAAVTLPFLEGLAPKDAHAAAGESPFAIFFRQANGVAAAQDTQEIGAEPERFYPTAPGALGEATMGGRAVGELLGFEDRVLILGNVVKEFFPFGDGHANGCLQSLTATGPAVAEQGGGSEAGGESIDHRIGAQLNPDGRDSYYAFVGQSGWLGGACISHRGAGNRRSAVSDPVQGYQAMMGVDGMEFGEFVERQASVNDLVRDQMDSLLASPKLSALDRTRLQLHREAIRDLEQSLSCNLAEDEAMQLDGMSVGFDSDNGPNVLSAARMHMRVAALAVSCGYTRSAAIQVGNGNDGTTRYENLGGGGLMENFHFLSHRRQSHGNDGAVIPNSDVLHSYVDIQFMQAYRFLLEELDRYTMPNGQSALDNGMAIYFNDNGNGPAHAAVNSPWIIGGSACGYIKQGEYIQLSGGSNNHRQLLHTIGAATGVDLDNLMEIGDPGLPGGLLNEILA